MHLPRLTLLAVSALAVIAAVCGAATLAAGGASAPTRGATERVGPRLAVVVSPQDANRRELLTIGPEGDAPQTLMRRTGSANDGNLERPIWSPDGEQLAFFAEGRRYYEALYLLAADGSGLRKLAHSEMPGGPRTHLLGEPVFSLGGSELLAPVLMLSGSKWVTFADGKRVPKGAPETALWSLPVDGSRPHGLEPWSRGFTAVYPYSLAPDGTLAGMVAAKRGAKIVLFDPKKKGSARTLVAGLKESNPDPAVSPDGSQVAFLRNHVVRGPDREPRLVSTDVMLVPIAGGTPRQIAKVPGGAFWLSWDPSGSRLAFTAVDDDHAHAHGVPGPQSALMEINANGSCMTTVYKAPPGGGVWGGAWQPGEGRGAGPISC